MFPIIKTIDDVLPAVEGRDEFVVADKGDYVVVNYNVGFEDTFDIDPENPLLGQLRRECRGIIFYPNGELMSRPFHKFFNIGEREETLLHNIDMSRDHFVMEKMDGSMIRPLDVNGELRLGTKMGVTDTSIHAESWMALNDHNVKVEWMKNIMAAGITPLFEFVSPANHIVLQYANTDLVLLAMRLNETGQYLDLNKVDTPFTHVPRYGAVKETLEDYIARQRGLEGREGDIISFGNEMHKLKNDWYVRIHKVKDKIRTDRHILALLLENELDDVYPHLDENDYNRVKKYERDFHEAYQQTLAYLENAATMAIEGAGGDRKRLATEILPNSVMAKSEWSFVFSFADGKDLNDVLMRRVRSGLGNTSKYNELAHFLGLDDDKGEDNV